ncbi:hypothetical protein IFO70_32805 [Phormidium tenue FACHB-886]|nr:hypothetical protein [Phormidium tenue FACHB-886]
MKQVVIISAIALTLSSAFISPSYAQAVRPPAVNTENPAPRERSDGYEVISDQDWRDTDPDLPWSTPVIVRDDFNGDYLAVFDRNFVDRRRTEDGVISNWSRDYVRVFVYHKQRRCGAIPLFCDTRSTDTFEASQLQIKVGERVLTLEGENGNFPISDEVASALASAPAGGARIRISLEESGAAIVNDIGEETVAAWRVVYGEGSRSAVR